MESLLVSLLARLTARKHSVQQLENRIEFYSVQLRKYLEQMNAVNHQVGREIQVTYFLSKINDCAWSLEILRRALRRKTRYA